MTPMPAFRAARGLRILRRPRESVRPSSPRPERRDCHGRLGAALVALAGEGAYLAEASFRPWCSATFVGSQHRYAILFEGPEAPQRAERLASTVAEAELPIPGHVLADVTVDSRATETGGRVRLVLTALTVEDW